VAQADACACGGVIADDVKQTIQTTTTKLNDLDLGLDHF